MNNTSKPLGLAQFNGHTVGPWRIGAVTPSKNPAYTVYSSAGRTVAVIPIAAHGHSHHDACIVANAPTILAECRRLRESDTRQREEIKVLRFVAEKALTRSAIVHPGFADEIRAALKVSE